jgi:murein DD-endopeptidase MepM/ murein hydrolase activator NlpD
MKTSTLAYSLLGGVSILGILLLAKRSLANGSGARVWPVSPNRGVLSAFGTPRYTSGNRFHAGVDVAAMNGDKVLAIDDGEVLYPVTGYSIGAGLQAVAIRHPDADYIYGEIDVLVKAGQTVKAGDVIGTVRQNDAGPGHQMLHLEAWESGFGPTAFTPWNVGSPPPPHLLNAEQLIAPLAGTGIKP